MSSCFLCDTSYKMSVTDDDYQVVYAEGEQQIYYMKYMPIMIGSSGMTKDEQQHVDNNTDQQHNDNNKQNYVSYRVKKIEFFYDVNWFAGETTKRIPNYIILFKVPFREPIFDYYFTLLKNFILFSEPESVLAYRVCPNERVGAPVAKQKFRVRNNLIVNKPFIVGPNDYVGVLYFFNAPKRIDSSARVWFDVV